MSWTEEARKRAAETRRKTIAVVEAKYRRALAMIDELAKSLDDGADTQPSSPPAHRPARQKPAKTPTEAIREFMLAQSGEFTKETLLAYIRDHYPSLRSNVNSAFNKLRKAGKIALVKPGTIGRPGQEEIAPTFRAALIKEAA